MLPISSLLQAGTAVWTISPDSSVFDALKILAERNIGIVPVVKSGKLIGIFSERDFARRVGLLERNSRETAISEVMTENVVTVRPDDSIDDCMKIVVAKGFRHLPVVRDGELIAIVSASDLLAQVIRSQEEEIGSLIDFIGYGS